MPLVFGGLVALFGLGLTWAIYRHPEGMSEGVPHWVGLAAGFAFALAGLMVASQSFGPGTRADGLLPRLLVALLLTAFAAASMIFPPGGLLVAYMAVHVWIGVYASIHQAVTGRDPMAGMSDRRQFALGCLVFVVLLLALAIGWRWRARLAPADDHGLPEARPVVQGR
jgi:hypothetical protein